MKLVLLIIFALVFIQSNQNCGKEKMENLNVEVAPTPKKQVKYDRLPGGIELETKVRKDTKNDKGEVISFDVVTVEEILTEMKASYVKNKLVDEKGREIKFFEPLCNGVSQGFEEDQKAQKAKADELAALTKTYTVIVLYCDPQSVM